MTGWQILLHGVHSIACVVIIVMAVEAMRVARNAGAPFGMQIVAYYLTIVGAFGYLLEPLAGWHPTTSDVLFEIGVAMYLVDRRMRGGVLFDLKRRKSVR